MVTLREMREQRGMTQAKLASMVGVTQVAISLIETGERRPSVQMAKKIASVLNIAWPDLYADEIEEAGK